MDATDHKKATASQIMVTLAAFVVVVAGMRAATTILVPFLMAAFIAIVSAGPMFWLKRKGIPAWLSLVIVIFGIILIGLLVSALLSSSVKAFSVALPTYETKLKNLMDAIVQRMNSFGISTSGVQWSELVNPGSAMKLVASGLNSFRMLLTNGFLILMTVIFMLIEASSLPSKLRAIFGDTESVLINFDRFIDNVKQYMVIKTMIGFVTGVLVAALLWVVGVDFALLWGLLSFLLNYIPNIGSIIAAVPAVLLAIIQLGLWPAIAVTAGYFVINVVMGNVIEPRFMGRSLGLSTLVVFLSLLFWGWVLGLVGMLLSVPLTMTAKIALDTREETRWLSILLGPEKIHRPPVDPHINQKEKTPVIAEK